MVEPAAVMLLEQFRNRFPTKELQAPGIRGQQRIMSQFTQFFAEPVVERYSEAHFRPLPDGGRQKMAERCLQHSFAAAALVLPTDR